MYLIQRNDPAADNAFFCSPLVSVAIAIYYICIQFTAKSWNLTVPFSVL